MSSADFTKRVVKVNENLYSSNKIIENKKGQ